jgi:hypothetical protein
MDQPGNRLDKPGGSTIKNTYGLADSEPAGELKGEPI